MNTAQAAQSMNPANMGGGPQGGNPFSQGNRQINAGSSYLRGLFGAILFLLLAPSLWATTTVTGTLQNLGTGTVGQGAFVRFWLRGCGGNQPRVNGTAVIAPSQGGVFFFDIAANSSGVVSGTVYSTRDATGVFGGDITCGVSTTSVWYGVQIFVGGKGGPEIPTHAKNTATLDITQIVPITTNPVITAPTGDSTYARLDAANLPFTGNVQAPNLTATSQLKSNVATGIPPLVVASTTQVANLNAATAGSATTATTATNLAGPGTATGNYSPTGAWNFSGQFSAVAPSNAANLLTINSPGFFSGAAMGEHIQSLIHGSVTCNPTTEFNFAEGAHFAEEGITACLDVPNTAPAAPAQNNSLSGYVVTHSTTSNAMGLNAQCRVVSNPGLCWGIFSLAMDAVGQTGNILNNEFDIAPSNAPATYNTLRGVQVILVGANAKGNYGVASATQQDGAFLCGSNATGNAPPGLWNQCYMTRDGHAVRSFVSGTSCVNGTGPCGTQPWVMRSYLGVGTLVESQLTNTSTVARTWTLPDVSGTFLLSGSASGGSHKEQRFTGVLGGSCPTAAAIGAACTSANKAWTFTYPDNNYSVVCSLIGPVSGQPHIVNLTYLAVGNGITVTIAADTAVAADLQATGILSCIADHD